MPNDIIDLDEAIRSLLSNYSASEISIAARELSKRKRDRELTIIVNEGMHSIPDEFIRGDKLVFSSGNIDLTEENAQDTVSNLMSIAHQTLLQRLWNTVYIIPSGHPLLVVAATMICYRTVRIDPIVVSYFDGQYLDVPLEVRKSIFKKSGL